jgi:putative intracellular protease/amidase
LSSCSRVREAGEGDYDGLVLPGGVANPDFLRTDDDAVSFVRSFFEAHNEEICEGATRNRPPGRVKRRFWRPQSE